MESGAGQTAYSSLVSFESVTGFCFVNTGFGIVYMYRAKRSNKIRLDFAVYALQLQWARFRFILSRGTPNSVVLSHRGGEVERIERLLKLVHH